MSERKAKDMQSIHCGVALGEMVNKFNADESEGETEKLLQSKINII